MSLSKNIEFLRQFRKINGFGGLSGSVGSAPAAAGSHLTETADFGPNPGQLRMLSYVPADAGNKPPLVVVLHGCTQTASGYDVGAGWSTLAKRYGFALLMPEQTNSNNPNRCFNWFVPEDTRRGGGEAASIRQMIDQMATAHHIDRDQVFVTGLSAGGAMTAVMLATYPETFAAGAVIAGLPYGVAGNVQQAMSAMMQSASRPAAELGDLVRDASKHRGPWPKLSVWHGSADRTVNPSNADELVKQWLDLHQLPSSPMSTAKVDGYPRQVWWNAAGETVVESYTITNMAHGTPLGTGESTESYGAQGAYLLDVGISSSYHIAKFFGLTERIHRPASATATSSATASTPAVHVEQLHEIPRARKARAKQEHRDEPHATGRRGFDVNAVITRALTAAGLMK